jgi:DNA repair exonuclease SbcCD ATPase subunit
MRAELTGLCCCLLAVVAFAADPAAHVAPTKTEIDQKLAALVQRQVELSFTLRDQLQKNETLWMDPKYTSPEIEKLRQRLNDRKQELMQLQLALRQRVEELPAARAEIGKVEQGKAEYQTLARQIEELKKQREQAP